MIREKLQLQYIRWRNANGSLVLVVLGVVSGAVVLLVQFTLGAGVTAPVTPSPPTTTTGRGSMGATGSGGPLVDGVWPAGMKCSIPQVGWQ